MFDVIDGGAPAESAPAAPVESGSLLGSFDAPAEAPVDAPAEQPVAEASEPIGFDVIPEAFRVMEGDQMNYLASTQNLAKAYAERAAYGDIPEVYSAPEGITGDWNEVRELPAVKQFAEQAKALGMTDKQFGFALQHIGAAERDGRNFAISTNREQAEATLRQVWAEPETFNQNMSHAQNAVRALIPAAEQNEFGARYGNDPTVLQLLARIGSEISEDTGVNSIPVPTGEDVQTLMRSEAYYNSAHPDHKATHAKVQRYYEKQYGTQSAL